MPAVLFVLGAMLMEVASTRHENSLEDFYSDEEFQEIYNKLEDFEHSLEDLVEDEQTISKPTHSQGRQLDLDSGNITDGKYEITENVLDIPNNETIPGPIVTNFTIPKPLNIIPNATDSDEHYDKTNKETVSLKPKKHTFSIFHVKAEFEDDKPDKPKPNLNSIPPAQVFNFNNLGIRDYLNGVRRGFANGLNSYVNRNLEREVNKGIFVPNVAAAPVKYLQGLQTKGLEAVRDFHDVVFGNKV